MAEETAQYVSRAGLKLHAALEGFCLDVRGRICADFGCNVGGFTDCLLRRGAQRVYAVDTGYGELAWKLRNDPRVTVMERTNALYCDVPEPVELVVIDVAWTPQRLSVPAAMRWLKPGGTIVSLLKPHYELAKLRKRKPHEALSLDQAQQVCRTVCQQLFEHGYVVRAAMLSTLRGKGGNAEFLLLIGPERPGMSGV